MNYFGVNDVLGYKQSVYISKFYWEGKIDE